jgi:hypothetical protein
MQPLPNARNIPVAGARHQARAVGLGYVLLLCGHPESCRTE